MSRIKAVRVVASLLAALAACGVTRNPHVEDLDDIPRGCRILFQAGSWEELVLKSRPSAVLSRDSYLLVWSRKEDDGSWSFEMAEPFLIRREGAPLWVVLSEPEEWSGSPLESLFVHGKAKYPTTNLHDGPNNYAELVGTSKSWGTVFKVACTSAPGGAKGNQSTLAILLWQRPDGGCEILWEGSEYVAWSGGIYGASEDYQFSLSDKGTGSASPLPFDIRVDHRAAMNPSFDLDRQAHLILDLHRQGRLGGPPPMEIEWTGPWTYEAQKGDTWESLMDKISFYGYIGPERAKKLKEIQQENPLLSSGGLKEGQTINLPAWIRP